MPDDLELRKIVAEVAAAYFTNSHVISSEIPTVIGHIAASLAAVGSDKPLLTKHEGAERVVSPAQARKSITRDALVSFEDNRPYKTLRRHLAARGLTPDQYRLKWGLPGDYPMVAPAYSEARSAMARAIGLGSRTAPKSAAAEARRKATRKREAQPAEPVTTEAAHRGARARARRKRLSSTS